MKLFIYLFMAFLPCQILAFQVSNTDSQSDSLFSSRYASESTVFSDSSARDIPEKKSGLGDYFYKVVWVTFVLVIFLVIGLALYKKYVVSGNGLINNRIKILGRQSISTKQCVLVVSIEGKKYALGATDHSVNLIAELGGADPETELSDHQGNSGFAQILKKISAK